MNTTNEFKCQVCDSPDLQMVFDAGWLPAVNVMRKVGEPPSPESFYPAQLYLCSNCQLVQLGWLPEPREVFPESYPYRSGSTGALLDNFVDLVTEIGLLGYAKVGDLVCDVGCNDGSLLQCFADAGLRVSGYEPTVAWRDTIPKGFRHVFNAFFGKRMDKEFVYTDWDNNEGDWVVVRNELPHKHWFTEGWLGKAKIVTACNVFAHMPDVHDALDCVLEILADDGVFVIEAHYLMTLLSKCQFDAIYHEHCRYYSLTSLKHLLEMHGMEVLRCKQIPTHGGSIRVYAARKGKHTVDGNSMGLLWAQYKEGSCDEDLKMDFELFQETCLEMKLSIFDLLMEEEAYGKDCIYGIGAPSRATTLIHYCGLDHGVLSCVCEQTGSKKIGCVIPGTSIPVVDEAKLYEDQPPYALILSWHLAEEIIGKLKAKGYRGRVIVPLPYPRIVA